MMIILHRQPLKIIVLTLIKHKIKVNTLDNLIKKKCKSSLTTFVKIDVEGMEQDVLEGMKTFIDKYKSNICLEINPYLWTKNLGQQYKKSEILNILDDYQYNIEQISIKDYFCKPKF